ncbi:TadE/TadG family type IV pilus assembly protein [Brevibacillus borstelensis]|jgi:Flp pilus assembly protein TadG|uniref:TadE/TadG family type IV pilus assembly protein n=1 Tax=Brevibacillus borstelensis TaxID=45462 RepID=UPI001562D1D1|nr:TadE/TadG family type IV pilus assembly protein [Brevibacillus borstelensis]MBE5394485.1 pilus assembly protein [Brevibacillus borstelensis]MED1852939.1 TadE/TadG family type IV pilus assembly protein [Brevibacillus borstelensis]MED1874575.1 TadE/TadG family type IV pilus assembly protein [Brevibacillus borstelensis]
MKRNWFGLIRNERGTQILELILALPLLWFVFIFSFDQFSILYNRQKVLAAAYEAGRIAAVQPNFGLANYHAAEMGQAELKQGIGMTDSQVRLYVQGGWKKGNHFEAEATMKFHLLATGKPFELKESYHLMIENAEKGGSQ